MNKITPIIILTLSLASSSFLYYSFINFKGRGFSKTQNVTYDISKINTSSPIREAADTIPYQINTETRRFQGYSACFEFYEFTSQVDCLKPLNRLLHKISFVNFITANNNKSFISQKNPTPNGNFNGVEPINITIALNKSDLISLCHSCKNVSRNQSRKSIQYIGLLFDSSNCKFLNINELLDTFKKVEIINLIKNSAKNQLKDSNKLWKKISKCKFFISSNFFMDMDRFHFIYSSSDLPFLKENIIISVPFDKIYKFLYYNTSVHNFITYQLNNQK